MKTRLVTWLMSVGTVFTALGEVLTWWPEASSWTWSTNTVAWNAGESAWFNAATAVFPDGTNGVITVADDVSVSGLDFGGILAETNGYQIVGTGAITLTIGSEAATIAVATGMTARITAPLAGATPFVKTGQGTLVLGGNSTGYAPEMPVEVREGVLQLMFNKPNALGSRTTQRQVTVSEGATFDLGGAGQDTNPLNFHVRISGRGFNDSWRGEDLRGALCAAFAFSCWCC